ncbi:MAG: DoxX family protein [Acidobacteriaceae bacterium]
MSAPAPSRLRLVAYWLTTLLIASEMALGGYWDLARTHYVRAIMDHLGYPLYMLSVLGFWKIAGAFAIVIPRFTRLKEWAYAGMFFNYSGAAASHLLAGDGPRGWAGPALFALISVASWALRPSSRVLGGSLFAPANPVTSAPAHASSL